MEPTVGHNVKPPKAKNTGFVKSAHKHVHLFLGLIFNILFSIFEMNMQ